MDLHSQTTKRLPAVFTLSIIVVFCYYLIFLVQSVLTLTYPRHNMIWSFLLESHDVLYILETAQTNEKNVSTAWIYMAEKFHKGNPVVLNALADYALNVQNDADRERLLARINELDPYNVEYRNKWIEYLVSHHRVDATQDDLERRGFEGLDEKWTPHLYILGLELLRKGALQDALLFWRVAAIISPSWSHMWIEYASLLNHLGKNTLAKESLEFCSKDTFAGPHCQDILEKFMRNDMPPPGIYSFILIPVDKSP